MDRAAVATQEAVDLDAARRGDEAAFARLIEPHRWDARGADALWGMYQWLDRAPKGRNESGPWFRRHDEYDAAG